MKRVLSVGCVAVLIVLLTCMASSAGSDSSRIVLLDPPPDQKLVLEVGEVHLFEIEVAEGDPFVLAMAMPDAFYPGRSIVWHGNDIAHRGDSALLQLTMIATSPTADLDAVQDWPDDGTEWPAGVAPVSIVVGVRIEKNIVVSERFDFCVEVVEVP